MGRSKDYKIKQILPMVFILLIFIIPIFASAANIVPCGGNIVDTNGNITGKQPECNFGYLMELINNIINWIIMISIPVAAGVFAWAGLLMMWNADNPNKRKDSIDMMKKVGIGFVFILAAWIIVNTITNTLLRDEFRTAVPVEGTKK